MATAKSTTLLSPGLVTGFASARAPLSLPKNLVSFIGDGRLDDGAFRLRWGGAAILAAIAGSATYRGSFRCVLNGTRRLFVALGDGSKVSIYSSTDHGLTWTSVSPTTGYYGDTRLSDVGPVYFAIVTGDSADYVAIQNGTDAPRGYDGTAMFVVPTSSVVPLEPTTYFTVNSLTQFTTSSTIANSNAAHLAGANATTGARLRITVNPTVVPTDTVTVSLGASFVFPTLAPSQAFLWLVDSGNEVWRNLKIEVAVSTSGPWTTVYDPATTPLIAVASDGTSYLASSQKDISTLSGTTCGALRFSYVGDAPTTAATVLLYALANEGNLSGTTRYAAAYESSTQPGAMGGVVSTKVAVASPVFPIRLPESPLVEYYYSVQDYMPLSTPAPGTGYDKVGIYRKDVGASGYYRIGSTNLIAAPPTLFFTYSDSGAASPNYSRPLPRADALTLPVGTYMASVNGRLMVCGGGRFWYSEADKPFAFARTVQFDNSGNAVTTSAGSFGKPGETFKAIAAVGQVLTGAETQGTPQMGAVSLYILTDVATYVVSGFDALSLNKTVPICLGTRSPFSVARSSSGGFYFLDVEYQVRKVVGTTSTALSRYGVDDQTTAIPDARLPWVAGECLDDRFYMGYTPSGGTANARVMVFNETLGEFESIDAPEAPAQGLLAYYDPTAARTKLLQFTTVGLNEHAQPGRTTEPSGAKVAATIVFGEQAIPPDVSIQAPGFTLVADADAGGTATPTILPSTGSKAGILVSYGALKLDPVPAGATRVARATPLGKGGEPSLTVVPTLGVLASGGKRLYVLSMDVAVGTPSSTR